MDCYPPLGKILSKVLGKCNGRERWREGRLDFDYALAYPPTETHHMQAMQPVARAVTFASNNSIYVIPPSPPPPQQPQPQEQSTPEPQQPQAPPPGHEPEQQHDAPESQPPQPQTEQPEPPEQQTQDAPPQAEPKPPRGPKRGKKKQPGRVRFGPEPPPPTQQEGQEQAQQEHAQQGPPGNAEKPPGQGQGPHGASPAPTPGYLLRYTPSPLPRWEATPRRHEYFSGEYRSYYPTPVREGIYRIATDANRLTTIFSEENPNACTIV